MTCSSSTIYTPDRIGEKSRWTIVALAVVGALIALIALVAAIAAISPGLSAQTGGAADRIAKARQDISKGDGVAAQIHLQQAMEAGAPREQVAAYLGEAHLLLGEPDRAREWLGPAQFSRTTAVRGFRALARLEIARGDLPAAGAAYDRVLELAPENADVWVDIGRLRYLGGERRLAFDAAQHALKLDANNARALTFRGIMARDREGYAQAIPWFERALGRDPKDLEAMGEYAATLGEQGRMRDMLAMTRRMLKVDRDNSRAFYLQAMLAARAGDTALARRLLLRLDPRAAEQPAAVLLLAVLQIRDGAFLVAAENLQKLVRRQPGNAQARDALARALYLAGEYGLVISDNAAAAGAPEASAYLLTLVARAHEAMGRRDLAAPLLDRAALAQRPAVSPARFGSDLGALLAQGDIAAAEARIAGDLAVAPGLAPVQIRAGDVALFVGDAARAVELYSGVVDDDFSPRNVVRLREAYRQTGQTAQADSLVRDLYAARPHDPVATRLALVPLAGGADVAATVERAEALLRAGDGVAAQAAARQAYVLQPSSPRATEAWRKALNASGADKAALRALTQKTQAFDLAPAAQ